MVVLFLCFFVSFSFVSIHLLFFDLHDFSVFNLSFGSLLRKQKLIRKFTCSSSEKDVVELCRRLIGHKISGIFQLNFSHRFHQRKSMRNRSNIGCINTTKCPLLSLLLWFWSHALEHSGNLLGNLNWNATEICRVL